MNSSRTICVLESYTYYYDAMMTSRTGLSFGNQWHDHIFSFSRVLTTNFLFGAFKLNLTTNIDIWFNLHVHFFHFNFFLKTILWPFIAIVDTTTSWIVRSLQSNPYRLRHCSLFLEVCHYKTSIAGPARH